MFCVSKRIQSMMAVPDASLLGTLWSSILSYQNSLNLRSYPSEVYTSLLQTEWPCSTASRVHVILLNSPILNCTLHFFFSLTPRHYKVSK